ncbi:MAG: hypothetical protein MUC64_09910 [Rubritepida sp.]|nr:hypothetical protein [Rubritepida sp.]
MMDMEQGRGVRSGRRAVLAAAALGACAPMSEADLALLYNPAAQHHGPDRNPIIVIPGLLGSRLRDPASGRIVWGAFDGNAADPRREDGARLVALPFTDLMSSPGAAVEADVVLDRVRIRVAGIPIALQAYAEILSTLGAGGYRDESLGLGGEVNYGSDHFTCFQFAYDWRQDNVVNARRLMAFIREKRAFVQGEYARRYGVRDAAVRFDIVAHSMGGLVARYAMLYGGADLPADGSMPPLTWEGAAMMGRVIQIGSPNGGSLDAFRALVNGRDFGAPIVPAYSPAILGTFPSLYQLVPRQRSAPVVLADAPDAPLDLLDPAVWQRMGWGLAAPGLDADLATLLPDVPTPEERRRIALALQARLLRRGRAFSAALEREVVQPRGTELMVVVGDSMPTAERMTADPSDGRIAPLAMGPGDGTVLRDSALLDFRQGRMPRPPGVMSPMDIRRALFLPREHLELTRDATFRNNILYWLLEEPRRAT